ncbi:Uma2 family endonuclease [Luteolibacter sp. SL250]|uniref:Uma2 family endonuclease n=1 Tax=Luteolibacter sp. SL250 TaxID=2995170 RepID=UPI00226EF08A|nr:Uma2 family endonuclease [Luteolibacter sp. SL250]WAC21075.1 Uma2 family endonuclease [Luteolibacter sp. SL250]
MTAVPKHHHLGIEEYLAGELTSETKHEYLGGAVHAMAGASNRHNEISSNIMVSLGSGLRGKSCRVFNSDTKVRIELTSQTRFYYPDAMVVCQKSQDSEQFQQWPAVIVEVLSDSTRRTDLTEKKEAYLTIPSLKVLIFVESDEPLVLVHRRGPSGGFTREEYFGLEKSVPLPEVETELKLAEIYERVEF